MQNKHTKPQSPQSAHRLYKVHKLTKTTHKKQVQPMNKYVCIVTQEFTDKSNPSDAEQSYLNSIIKLINPCTCYRRSDITMS